MKRLMVVGAILAGMTPGLRAQDSASQGSGVTSQANVAGGFYHSPLIFGNPKLELPGIEIKYGEIDRIIGSGGYDQQIVREYEALKEILGEADSRQIRLICGMLSREGVVEKKQVEGLKAKDLIEIHFVYRESGSFHLHDLSIRYQERKGLISRETASKTDSSGNITIVDKKTGEVVGSFNTFGFSRD